MNPLAVSVSFALALLTMLGLRLWLTSRQIRHVARHRDAVPAGFAARVSLQAHQRAADYTLARQRFELLALAWSGVVLLGWTLLGGLDWLNGALRSSVIGRSGPMSYQLALILAVSLIGALLELPLDAWRTFRIEQAHGFNHTTVRLWLRDLVVGGAVGLVVMLPLAALLLWLMNEAGQPWWLWAFAAMGGFMVLMQWAYPTLIAPLFNKFEPLGDEILRGRVERLMQRCGFRARGLFVMDGSRRSAHANAYFTGVGASKRVVFFDTLLTKLAPEEVEAVLAHELGHFKLRHVPKRMAVALLVMGGGLALVAWLMNQPAFYVGLGVQPALQAPNHALALILLTMVAPVFTFFVSPLAAAVSRRHEFEADAYACRQSSAPALAAALLKLYEDNAATLTPDPLYVRFHYSHPPATARLAALPGAVLAA